MQRMTDTSGAHPGAGRATPGGAQRTRAHQWSEAKRASESASRVQQGAGELASGGQNEESARCVQDKESASCVKQRSLTLILSLKKGRGIGKEGRGKERTRWHRKSDCSKRFITCARCGGSSPIRYP